MLRYLLCIIVVLSCALSANSQEGRKPETDANDLLAYCGEVVNFLDSSRPSGEDVAVGWCAGYIEGTVALLRAMQILMGVEFSERMTKGPAGICIPDEVRVSQVARIIVKYLREHPEELHQDKGGLTVVILRDAFACQAVGPTKEE